MKKLLLLVVPLMLAAGLYGQEKEEKPDKLNFRKIAEEGYDSLASRLKAGDTTLTIADFAALYYSFAYRPEYRGSDGYGEDDAMGLYRQGAYREAHDLALQALDTCPVSLPACELIMLTGFQLMTAVKELQPYSVRMQKIMEGILSCGDGKSRKTAIKVLSVPDEYVIMRMLGVKMVDRYLEDMQYDVTKVRPSELYPEETIYFDVTPHLNYMVRNMNKSH